MNFQHKYTQTATNIPLFFNATLPKYWLATLLFLLSTTVMADTYQYDKAGRLTTVNYDDGTSITYQYDANGNLIGQTSGAANQAPVAIDDAFDIVHNATTVFSVAANDSDDGTLDLDSIIIVTQPQSGSLTVTPTTGELVYTPNTGFAGVDTFSYQISDNLGLQSNVATVTLTVQTAPPSNDNGGGGSTGGSSGGGSLSIVALLLMVLGCRRRRGFTIV